MYLNSLSPAWKSAGSTFNYNMGCIWIRPQHLVHDSCPSLTITWDVFEFPGVIAYRSGSAFNYNMGCIWIILPTFPPLALVSFNYNMGCIWIIPELPAFGSRTQFNYNMGCIWITPPKVPWIPLACLTITWDVFELYGCGLRRSEALFNYNMGCIWISTVPGRTNSNSSFNYNMGCIWIIRFIHPRHWTMRLTITWDVFEWRQGHTSLQIGSCLTITWDVFEFTTFTVLNPPPCLTITWDVFEWHSLEDLKIWIAV